MFEQEENILSSLQVFAKIGPKSKVDPHARRAFITYTNSHMMLFGNLWANVKVKYLVERFKWHWCSLKIATIELIKIPYEIEIFFADKGLQKQRGEQVRIPDKDGNCNEDNTQQRDQA